MAYEDATVVVPSGAQTTSGNGNAYRTQISSNVSLLLDVTAVSGTTPSMTVEVVWSMDGTNFASAETPDTFSAVTATGRKVKTFPTRAPWARLAWTITGTTPSFTFAVSRFATG